MRVTAFSSGVRDAVANVTVATAPGLVTRERRNVGRVQSRGLEVEAEALLGARAAVTAGYALTDARVRSFPDEPALEGRRLPQVPRHQATLQVRYESRWRLGLQARWTSAAFEDDLNRLSLDEALLVDLSAGRLVASGVELFAAAENVFDAEVVSPARRCRAWAPPNAARRRAVVHSSRAVGVARGIHCSVRDRSAC